MSDDQIDIYDADLRPLGRMDWLEAHKTGQWHRTFHCWVYSSAEGGKLLFQARSPHGNFPNLFDVSAAGHLDAGETLLDGVREVQEELGIRVDSDALHHVGERVEVADQANGQRNREYQSVYLLQLDEEATPLTPDPKEVWGAFWMRLSDGFDLFSGRKEHVSVTGIEYQESDGGYRPATRTVSTEDFIPRVQRYYLAALICVERVLDGKSELAIS